MKQTCSRPVLWLVIVLIFSGCSSELDQLKEQNYAGITQAQTEITQLKKHLNGNLIRNANLLEIYARVVGNMNTQLEPLTEALAKDATAEGPMVKSLEARLQDAAQLFNNSDIQLQQAVALNDEINNIILAANPDLYGLMLTDPINVLADMSKGELARVEAMSKEASLKVNNAADGGAGSQLVGNPNYGQWQTNSSGNSFWAWYGQYALISSLFGGRQHYYGGWAGRRDYSYYHDYGRNQYSSPAQRQTQKNVEQRTKKSFNQSGKKFQSPYAKQKSGSSSVRAKTSSIRKSASRKSFNSGYARSSGNSSSRTSSFSRSTRRSGGK